MFLAAGRAAGSGAAATGAAAMINPDAAIPAPWKNSRLFDFLAMKTPHY